jgi:hypothetical protein
MRKAVLIGMILISLSSCATHEMVEQVTITRIALMPEQPAPYKMTDWYEKAHHFDQYVFNLDLKGAFQPFIWIDSAQRNFPQNTFGMYTVIGDVRQGSNGSKEFHEALCSMGSVLGAGLVGIDKTNQNGFNYVKMTQNYFNAANGWNIMTGGTTFSQMSCITVSAICFRACLKPTVYSTSSQNNFSKRILSFREITTTPISTTAK